MGVDAKWGRFPICPEMSRFVPVCPLCPSGTGDKSGQKRTNGDKTGHFGTNWETPPFSIYPHLAPVKFCLSDQSALIEPLSKGFLMKAEIIGKNVIDLQARDR